MKGIVNLGGKKHLRRRRTIDIGLDNGHHQQKDAQWPSALGIKSKCQQYREETARDLRQSPGGRPRRLRPRVSLSHPR